MGSVAILRDLVHLLAPRDCAACDAPLGEACRGFCDACDPLLDRMPHGPACFAFGGPLAEAIRRYKYQRRDDLAEPLGRLFAEIAPDFLGRVDRVVPVPPTRRSLRQRGFDAAALLAVPIARELDLPLHRALRRVRETPPQASLGGEARRRAQRGAFVADSVDGQRILLIDDVATTGATLEAATLALLAGGARVVHRRCLAGSETLALRATP